MSVGGGICVHNSNNQGLAGNLEWTGGGKTGVFCTRCRGQTSLAVKLLQPYVLTCAKESDFSLSRD